MRQRAKVLRQGLLIVASWSLVPVSLAVAQTAATGASVSWRAVGPAAPVATPIGGLVTRPLSSAGLPAPRRIYRGGVLVNVADAPRTNAGVVVNDEDTNTPRFSATWTPTAEAPRWRRDDRVRQVDAWRDLIVSDVVCSAAGVCRPREQRVRAPWLPRCGCYAFADGWNRLWRVE